MPTLHRNKILATCVCIAMARSAEAGPRSLGQRAVEETVAPEGIEFAESLIAEAMELLRAGKTEEAIERLQPAAAAAKGERGEELKLGLAMLYLRAGQKNKATLMLKPLLAHAQSTSVIVGAKVVQRVAGKARGNSMGSAELASVEGWAEALTRAASDITKDVAKEQQLLYSALTKRNGDQTMGHMRKAHALLDEADAIRCLGAADERAKAVQKHLEGLANGIRFLNDWIDTAVRDAHNMEVQIKGNRPRGRRHRPGGGDPTLVDEHNKLCGDIERAWEAGKQLQDEYEQVTNQRGLANMNQRARMRMPLDRLPKPFTQP